MIFPAARTEVTSTVSGLSDDQLLKQTRKLAGLDHQIHVFVIDHLIEIEARRVYLDRGFSSLFDYVKRGLGYTDAATWRRTSAMKLCVRIEGVRERLWDGSLTLDAAAQLQAAFERRDRFQRRDRKRAHTARGAGVATSSAMQPNGSAAPAGSAPPKPEPEATPGPMLDLSAQKALVEQAAGKSTREVAKMLADVDPELAAPADRVRPLGAGRWELKAVIDAECERGLEQLKGLLSHVDPHMTLGQLVGRLVSEGLDRHDPGRSRRRARTRRAPAGAGRPPARRKAGSDGDTTSEPKRPATNANAADSAPKAQAGSARVLSPAQRPAQPAVDGSSLANPQRNTDGRATSAPKRTDRTSGIGTSASKPDRDSDGRELSAARQPSRRAGCPTFDAAPVRRFGAAHRSGLGRSRAVASATAGIACLTRFGAEAACSGRRQQNFRAPHGTRLARSSALDREAAGTAGGRPHFGAEGRGARRPRHPDAVSRDVWQREDAAATSIHAAHHRDRHAEFASRPARPPERHARAAALRQRRSPLDSGSRGE